MWSTHDIDDFMNYGTTGSEATKGMEVDMVDLTHPLGFRDVADILNIFNF